MRRPARPDGTALRHPGHTGLLSVATGVHHDSGRITNASEHQPDAPRLRVPSFWRRCPPSRSPVGTGRFRGGPANRQSNTAGRHLLPTGRSFSPNGTVHARAATRSRSRGSPDRVSRPSDAVAPCRLTRHVAAGNAVTEPSTSPAAERPTPDWGGAPCPGGGVCSAGPHSRFSATSWNGRVRVAVDVGSSESDTKPGPPVFAPLRVSSWPCRARSPSYRSQARPSLSRSIRR